VGEIGQNREGKREDGLGQALKILILASILFGGHRVADVPQQVSGKSTPASATTN